MNNKSLLSVPSYISNNATSYESSGSSDCCSEDLVDGQEMESKNQVQKFDIHGLNNENKLDYSSDSCESDDQFLECESDFEGSHSSEDPFSDYRVNVNVSNDARNHDEKRTYFGGERGMDGKFHKLVSDHSRMVGSKSFEVTNHFSRNNISDIDREFVSKNPEYDSDNESNEEFKREDEYGNFYGQFIDPELVVHNVPKGSSLFLSKENGYSANNLSNELSRIQKNTSFSDGMYDDSDIGSEVHTELESRIINYHESKKNIESSVNGAENAEFSEHIANDHYIYEPEDEIDELFDRVINCDYDPDFTFMPEALDPYVKISQELFARKGRHHSSWNSKSRKKSSSQSSSSSSSSVLDNKAKTHQHKAGVKVLESKDGKDEANGVGNAKASDPTHSISENSSVTTKESGLAFENDEDRNNEMHMKDVEIHDPKLGELDLTSPDRTVKEGDKVDISTVFHDVIEFDKAAMEAQSERDRVRVLFESIKTEELSSPVKVEDDSAKSLKASKSKDEKKSKKSKHHKLESESEDEKHSKSEKKSEKKSSKSSKDKDAPNGDKPEVSEKADKHGKEKKSVKVKKLPWKSTDYDVIFNSLGECFSSGYIEHDSKPIVLPKRGFYTMFFRNSKYPYDSRIDFYLFRIGFKYAVVNESKSQPINIDDVVDYGNFRLRLSGNRSLSPNVTKMTIIYSNVERQLLEFTLTPSAFDTKPKVVYKMFYSGPMLSVPMPLKFKRSLRVLSLDNSENLGTSVIGSLYLLEKKLSELKKKKVNLADYFDYICGTGSGALIALCLLKGCSLRDLRARWHLIVSGLFKWVHSLPSGIIFDYYYIEEFKKNFINILGTDFLCSKSSPLFMVTCTNVRSNPYELFLFRNYGNSKFGSLNGTSYAPLWLVGWASCALPTYVRGPSNSHLANIGYNMVNKVHLVDGSVVSSSPSLVSLQELTNIYNINLRTLVKDNMDLFLSIGTSKSENDTGSINSSTWQILLNSKNLMYNTQLQHLHLKSLFEEYENKYHRIQLPIYPGCKHGKTSKEDVDAVLTSTIQYISRHDNNLIEQIVKILNQ